MEAAPPTHDEITQRLRTQHERLSSLRRRLSTLQHDYEHRAAGHTVYYAVDWSELLLFLIGGAGEVDVGFQADRSERDVLVCLALNHLFTTLSDTLYLLPPHASEMWSFIRGLRQRFSLHEEMFELAARALDQLPPNARKVLESLEAGTENISESELEAVIGLVKGGFKELCDHVMTLRALLDRDILGRLQRLLRERKVSYLLEPLVESLGGSAADLETSTDEVDKVTAEIQTSIWRDSKRRDATALLQLRSVNRLAAPDKAYMVLVTRDQSLRDAATTLAHEDWFEWKTVRKHFRHVETIYLDLALRGASSRDEALRWIDEVDEQFGKLEQLVGNLLNLLDQPAPPSASMPHLMTDVSALLDKARRVWHEHVNLRLSLADANVPWQVGGTEPATAGDDSPGSGASRREIALIRGLWEFVKTDRYRELARKSANETWLELHDDGIRMLLWSHIGEKGTNLVAQALAGRSEGGQTTLQSVRGVQYRFICSLQFVSERYQKLLANLHLGDDKEPKRRPTIGDAFLTVVRAATTDRREPEGFLCMAFLLGVLNLWDEARVLAERSLEMPGAKRVCEIEYFLAVAHRRLATADKRLNVDEYAAAYDHIIKAIHRKKDETGQEGSQDPRYLKERGTIVLEYHHATGVKRGAADAGHPPGSHHPSRISEQRATQFLEQALGYIKDDPSLRIDVLNNLAYAAIGRADLDTAERYAAKLDDELKQATAHNDPRLRYLPSLSVRDTQSFIAAHRARKRNDTAALQVCLDRLRDITKDKRDLLPGEKSIIEGHADEVQQWLAELGG